MPAATNELDPESRARAAYADVSDEEFWAWLQGILPAQDFEACRVQPRGFIQGLHQVAWTRYVEAIVEAEMNNWHLERDYYNSISVSLTVDSDWDF